MDWFIDLFINWWLIGTISVTPVAGWSRRMPERAASSTRGSDGRWTYQGVARRAADRRGQRALGVETAQGLFAGGGVFMLFAPTFFICGRLSQRASFVLLVTNNLPFFPCYSRTQWNIFLRRCLERGQRPPWFTYGQLTFVRHTPYDMRPPTCKVSLNGVIMSYNEL